MTAKRPTKKGLTNPEPLTPTVRDQELRRYRSQLRKGHVEAVMEHIEAVAQRDDPELLRGLVSLLVEAVRDPPKMAIGRPTNPSRGKVTISEGRLTIVSGDLLTQREQRQREFRDAKDNEVWVKVVELQKRYPRKYQLKEKAIRAVADKLDMTESAARKAFYRFQKP